MKMNEMAYMTLENLKPSMLESVRKFLDRGMTPEQIAIRQAIHNTFLGDLVELAAGYMLETKQQEVK